MERLEDIKAELKDHDSMETSLKFFSKAVLFLNISAERNQLGRNLRSTMLAAEHDPRDLVNTFLNSIGYGFADDLIREIKEQMLDDNPMLPAFNVFMSSNDTSLLDQNEQLQILRDHYGVALTDTLNRKSVDVAPLINVSEQALEASEFFIEFDETYMAYMALQERVKLEAKNKISSAELKSSDEYDYINARKPSPSQVYAAMCESGCLVRFTETMKLFKFAPLVPPSTLEVDLGFSWFDYFNDAYQS